MQRYDENYQYLISRLSSVSTQDEEDRQSVFDKLDSSAQSLIESMSPGDIHRIAASVHSALLDIASLTEEEAKLIEEIRKGKKTSYRQAIWRLTGEVCAKQAIQNYNELIGSEPAFHTFYLYEGMEKPVRIVCESEDEVFQIYDIRSENTEKQKILLKNVLAAENRCEFHIETDRIFRIRGFQTKDNELIAIVSFYPHIPFPIGIRGLLYKIFDGMRQGSGNVPEIAETTVRQISERLRRESIVYWKDRMLPLAKSLSFPGGSGRPGPKTILYKELSEEIIERLSEACETYGVSSRSIFLLAWGKLLGKYNKETNLLLLVAKSIGVMKLFPVKIKGTAPNETSLKRMEYQLAEAEHYGNCTIADVEEELSVSFSDFFKMAHHFMEFHELDSIGSGEDGIQTVDSIDTDDTSIELFVSYHLYEHNIGIQYMSKNGVIELLLDSLHAMFLDELCEILSLQRIGFDKASFIKVSDSDEEKLYKIRLAQIALYLKESGLFDMLSVDEIMKLAEYCRLSTYLMNDIIIEEKSRPSALYIVGEGMLEESMTARDGMVKSLRIIRKGSVFGAESLYSGKEASATYTVIDPQIKLVEIDADIVKELFFSKPEGLLALMECEMEQKDRLQQLWTME